MCRGRRKTQGLRPTEGDSLPGKTKGVHTIIPRSLAEGHKSLERMISVKISAALALMCYNTKTQKDTKLRQYKRRRRSPFPMNGQSIPGHDSAQNTAVLLRLETAGGMDVRAQNDPHQARHHLGARARRKVRSQVIGGAHPSHNVC